MIDKHYGEVSVHFSGGGKPLLLSITNEEFSSLNTQLDKKPKFIFAESMTNQMVMIRFKAIADLYFCHDNFDEFGPEHVDSYGDHILFKMNNARDWKIIEDLESGLFDDDVDEKDVQRIVELLELHEREAETIIKRATTLVYQLSNGKQREHGILDDCLRDAVWADGSILTIPKAIRIELSDSYHVAIINSAAIDYISIPTHMFESAQEAVIKELKMSR